MSTGTSKPTARKVMRVATIFTGVAGAVAFAAPAHAQAPKFPPGGPAVRAMPDKPHISSCTGSTHYFAMKYFSGPNVYEPTRVYGVECVGGIGGIKLPVAWSDSGFCGGNNVGYFSGRSKNGKLLTNQRFAQGSNFYYFKAPKYPGSLFKISKVYISAWTGSQVCQF
jgi:hypothetical protein